MNEDLMNKIMMIACMVVACIAGFATIAVVVNLAMDWSWGGLVATPLLGCVAGAGVYGTVYFGHRTTGFHSVFTNEAEREVLTNRQRRDLRKARGEVVMEKAMIEVEHERQNIVHNQIEASKDPEKPPHETQWSPGGVNKKELRNTPKRAFVEEDPWPPHRLD